MAPLDATAYSECSEVLAEPFKRDKVAPIMDTSIGSQYDDLREEVRSFFAANEDVAVPAGPGFGGDASTPAAKSRNAMAAPATSPMPSPAW